MYVVATKNLILLCEKIETKKLSKVSGTSCWVFHRDEIGLSPSLKHANLDELIDWSTAPIFSSEAGATIYSPLEKPQLDC